MKILRRTSAAVAAALLGALLIGGPAQADTSWGGVPVSSNK